MNASVYFEKRQLMNTSKDGRSHNRSPDQRQVSMSIPIALYNAVKRIAVMEKRSFSNMVTVMLENELVRLQRLASKESTLV